MKKKIKKRWDWVSSPTCLLPCFRCLVLFDLVLPMASSVSIVCWIKQQFYDKTSLRFNFKIANIKRCEICNDVQKLLICFQLPTSLTSYRYSYSAIPLAEWANAKQTLSNCLTNDKWMLNEWWKNVQMVNDCWTNGKLTVSECCL